MNATKNNILSRLEREYVSFLYDYALRTTTQAVTVDQIHEFIRTPEGQKGLRSFKSMRQPTKQESKPQQIGAFL